MSELPKCHQPKFGGHRGCGCTDHQFYGFRDKQTPIENTKQSFMQAFSEGAAYIETDAVMSKDGKIFCLHNVVPNDHFFASKPDNLLNLLQFSKIVRHKTGRYGTGEITLLSDALTTLPQNTNTPFTINIEIKGVQGSGQAYETNDFIDRLAESVQGIQPNRILWSSFALQNIISMQQRLPESHYGMLFSEKLHPSPIYSNMCNSTHYKYLPFSLESIQEVMNAWTGNKIYLHPESKSVFPELITFREQIAGINSWSLFPEPPDNPPVIPDWISGTHITDYLPQTGHNY